jgi:hypothetical protein
MIHHVCPNCQAALESADRLAGVMTWCPHCGAGVEVPQTAPPGLPSWARPGTEDGPSGRALGQCSLCGASLVPLRACQVRVRRIWTESTWLGGVWQVQRWAHVACSACNDCWRSGRRVCTSTWLPAALILSPLPFLLLFGLVADQLAVAAGRAVVVALFLGGTVGPFVLGLVLYPVCVSLALKRFVGRFSPETDRRLKALGGIERWGLRNRAEVPRRACAGEAADRL